MRMLRRYDPTRTKQAKAATLKRLREREAKQRVRRNPGPFLLPLRAA